MYFFVIMNKQQQQTISKINLLFSVFFFCICSCNIITVSKVTHAISHNLGDLNGALELTLSFSANGDHPSLMSLKKGTQINCLEEFTL